MTAEPIRDMLPVADRADFGRVYAAALEEAGRSWSLQPVDEVLEQWRRIAILAQSPGHKNALADGLRLVVGEDVPIYSADLEALRRGEIPATWPTRLRSRK